MAHTPPLRAPAPDPDHEADRDLWVTLADLIDDHLRRTQ